MQNSVRATGAERKKPIEHLRVTFKLIHATYTCIQFAGQRTPAQHLEVPLRVSHGNGRSFAWGLDKMAKKSRRTSPVDCDKGPPCSSTKQPLHRPRTESELKISNRLNQLSFNGLTVWSCSSARVVFVCNKRLKTKLNLRALQHIFIFIIFPTQICSTFRVIKLSHTRITHILNGNSFKSLLYFINLFIYC